MRAAREDWFERQPDFDPERLGFLDETAATTKMVRRYGRAPRGQRCRIAVPRGPYKTTTITAALRATGQIAKVTFEGATNGKTKALLWTAAARTADDLTIAIRDAFAASTPNECRNYLAAAGYDAYDPI